MIICICHNVSESELKSAVLAGSNDMERLRENLGVGSCCGKCKSCTKKILRQCLLEQESRHTAMHTLHFETLAA